jgi:signal transduction histidine kinase
MNTVFVRSIRIIIRVITFLIRLILLLMGYKAFQHKQAEQHRSTRTHKELQYRLNEFTATLSHDMKTPLTSIKGNIQLMARKMKNISLSDTEQRDDMKQFLIDGRLLLERTDQQINRLIHLINKMLETSYTTSTTVTIILENLELNALIDDIIQDDHFLPKERKLQKDVPEDKSVFVMADTSRIKEVLMHFLSNAHKYSEIDKPILIHLRDDGKSARIEVRDQGQGIPPHEQNTVWERFYRVPGIAVLSGSEVGLGVGLHISRAIIEQHKGEVGLKSVPGSGSTFWFTLPLTTQNG